MATESISRSLDIASVRIDGGTQPRAAISEGTVSAYAERFGAGIVLPPIDVFFDDVDHWLADGFHRYFAARKIERSCITAIVHAGTRREAVLFSVSANTGHGLKRTNADKRKAAMTLLLDDEWSAWSNVEISRRCGVSHTFVNELRSSLATVSSEKPVERTYTTKHGTEAQMRVENIGRKYIKKRQAIAEMLKAGTSTIAIRDQLSTSPALIAQVRREIGMTVGPDKSRASIQSRRDRIREMAADGHTSRQMSAAIGVSEQSIRKTARVADIDMPGDRATASLHRHDSNRIVAGRKGGLSTGKTHRAIAALLQGHRVAVAEQKSIEDASRQRIRHGE